MKMNLPIFLLSILLVACNDPELPVHKQNHVDFDVHSIPREPSKREEPKKCIVLKNETRFYTNLSSQFDFRLTVFNNDANPEPSVSVLRIYLKNREFIQKIEVANQLMGPLELTEVSSFETNVNHNLKGVDNMYGTLIVEDFNFDGLYDIALMDGCAVNGNSRYHYFLQSADSVFRLDSFLTKEVQTFPAKRNELKKELICSAIGYNFCKETTVQYSDSLGRWKKIKEVIYE